MFTCTKSYVLSRMLISNFFAGAILGSVRKSVFRRLDKFDGPIFGGRGGDLAYIRGVGLIYRGESILKRFYRIGQYV